MIPRSNIGPTQGLFSIAACITTENLFRLVPSSGTLMVHEADPILEQVLLHYAESRQIHLFLTTSRKSYSQRATHIHYNLPERLIKSLLPLNIAAFVNPRQDAVSKKVGKMIVKCLPQNCIIAGANSVFSKKVDLLTEPSADEGQRSLESAWKMASNVNLIFDDDKLSVPLSDLTSISPTSMCVLDWHVPSVSVEVQAIDEGIIFAPNKTYVLVGLAGEFGQSIARWMVTRGAKYVVLTSRHPKVDPNFIGSFSKEGACLRILSWSVTSCSMKSLPFFFH